MSQKLEKKLGAKENCRSCGQEMICLEQEYQGKKSLSWRNPDGTAHYNFDYQTKKTSCNPYTPPEHEMPAENTKDQSLLQNWTPTENYAEDLKKLYEIENDTRAFFAKNNMSPDGQKIGLWTKLIFQKRYCR